MDGDLPGVARGAETLLDVLGTLAGEGCTGGFAAADVDGVTQHGRIVCSLRHHVFAADAPEGADLRRLEGASDPDDMLAVAALADLHRPGPDAR